MTTGIDIEKIAWFAVLFFSIVVHEYAHGWTAKRCGDNTAELAGRLTFNPVPHIDMIGTIIIPLALVLSGSSLLFGWAKPVPVNPYNFRNPGIDNVKVSAAGPGSNILLAVVSTFFAVAAYYLVPAGYGDLLRTVFSAGISINIFLALLNLLPFAPLDGYHVLAYYIPKPYKSAYYTFQRYGPFMLLFLFLSGSFMQPSLLTRILLPPYYFLSGILTTIYSVLTPG